MEHIISARFLAFHIYGGFSHANQKNTPKIVILGVKNGGGESRTRVLIRETQTSTGLAVYRIVGADLAKRRAACPYSGKSYSAASGNGDGTSPDCDAEAVPQGCGAVPRDYAAKAKS